MNVKTVLTLLFLPWMLLACREDTVTNAPKIISTASPTVDPATLDNQGKLMALTDCMRAQGLDLSDPVVDENGNGHRLPEEAPGASITTAAYEAALDACSHYLDGITFVNNNDAYDVVDKFATISICLRNKGYDVIIPTQENFGEWSDDFSEKIDFSIPEEQAAYQECLQEWDSQR